MPALAGVAVPGEGTQTVTVVDLASAMVHELVLVLGGSPVGLDADAVRAREVAAHALERVFLSWLHSQFGDALPGDLRDAATMTAREVQIRAEAFLYDPEYLRQVGMVTPDGTT